MRNIWIIFRREMRSYFVSPVAYAILVAFLGLSGWYFYHALVHFIVFAAKQTEMAMELEQAPPIMNVNMGVGRPWFNIAGQLLLFLAPIITMPTPGRGARDRPPGPAPERTADGAAARAR